MSSDRSSPMISECGTFCSSHPSSSFISGLIPRCKEMMNIDHDDNTTSRCTSMIVVVGEAGGRRMEGHRVNRDRFRRRDRGGRLGSQQRRVTWSSENIHLDHRVQDPPHSSSVRGKVMSYPPRQYSSDYADPYQSTFSPGRAAIRREYELPLPPPHQQARYGTSDSYLRSGYQGADEHMDSGSGSGSGSHAHFHAHAGPQLISPMTTAHNRPGRPQTLEHWAQDLSRSQLVEFERLARFESEDRGAGDGYGEWVSEVFGRGWDERAGFPKIGLEVDDEVIRRGERRGGPPLVVRARDQSQASQQDLVGRVRPQPSSTEWYPYVLADSQMDSIDPRPSTSASTSTSTSTMAFSANHHRFVGTPQSRPMDIRSTVGQPIRQFGFDIDEEMYISPPALHRSKQRPSPAASSSAMTMGPPEGPAQGTLITPAGGNRRMSLASTGSGVRSLEKLGFVSLASGSSSTRPPILSTSTSVPSALGLGPGPGAREMTVVASGSGSGGQGVGALLGPSSGGVPGPSGLPRSMMGVGGDPEGGSGGGGGGDKGKQAGAGGKATKKKAAKACLQCQKAHLTCDDSRPCSRCVKKGQGDQCCEGQRKKAKYLMTEAELAEHNAKKRARARKPKPVEGAEQDVAKPSIRSAEDAGSPVQTMHRIDPEDDMMAGQVDDANDQAMDDVGFGNDMSLGQGFQFDSQAANLEYAVLDSIFSDLPGLAEQNGVESFMNAWQGAAMGSQSLIGGGASGQNQLGQDMMDFSMQAGDLSTGPPATAEVRNQNPVATDLRAMAIGSVGTQDSASSVYDSVSEPYDYTVSYHQLMRFLAKNFDQKSILRVVKSLAAFRPSLIALLMPLSFEDEVFLEKSFQRTLIELEKLISYSGTPTAVWRRTGEICVVGDEFVKLTGWSRAELLGNNGGKRKFWFELLDRASTVDYYAKFSQHAFENTAQNFYMPVVIKHGGETTGTSTPARELKCAASFTIRRDVFDLPCAVIGQLLPATG